ncbi:glycosyltransferase [Mucilaginibacter terrae]|uniref:Glycosyltransferase involved in cell wall biosynthesis n=1 Tax=Mucilaginibacter terrae TaxID=1955052 RepID=A0ABU3GYC7_9SPHI|nr:glycosyltransferase [Mucilaginibacter terrae]MDT3404778.1 glycosyltransferase involved in cell wall biosynthesis [Mucilaginibacter terrae]
MKVLHVNTVDFGGAATACLRIHKGLLKHGVDSKVLFLKRTKNVEETYTYSDAPTGLIGRLWDRVLGKIRFIRDNGKIDRIQQKLKPGMLYSNPTSYHDITKSPLYKEADIIQLNWVRGMIDEPSFFAKSTKPVIWRMPDLYTCGGGYHYETGFPFNELAAELKTNEKTKIKALKKANLTMVPISNWVKEKADASRVIGRFKKQVIHNGIDSNNFKPHDAAFARNEFNLPHDKIILLFGADIPADERKGYGLLLDALKLINRNDLCICVFGSGEVPKADNVYHVGHVNSEKVLSILYSAADYFIMPSIEEAFGQVTIESTACGTPVVSFPNGGSKDIIIDGLNGYLAADFTASALADAINKALDTQFDRKAIVEDTLTRFNINDKINEYITLYKSLLKA